MGLIRQGQSCLGSYRNTHVRGIYLICIRSRVDISVRVTDLDLISGSELVLPSNLFAVRLRKRYIVYLPCIRVRSGGVLTYS